MTALEIVRALEIGVMSANEALELSSYVSLLDLYEAAARENEADPLSETGWMSGVYH